METREIKSTLIALLTWFACTINASAQLYLIGDAVGGWSFDDNMIPMNQSGKIYSWSGHLNTGELKFLTGKSWESSWGPEKNGTEIKEGTIFCNISFKSSLSDYDRKFNVTEAGFYRIVLNTNGGYTRASITSYPATVYPYGTGTAEGYAVEMRETEFGSGIYNGNKISLNNNGKLVFLKQKGDGDYYGPLTDGSSLSAAKDAGNMREYTTIHNVTLATNLLTLTTDKACYSPGETVTFNSSVPVSSADGLNIRYVHNGKTIEDTPLTSQSWTWTAPSADYRGYMAEIYTTDGKTDVIHGTIAIDVSSDWKVFPRYGFIATFYPVSVYGNEVGKTDEKIQSEMAWLNRCHINGVQFQDWHWKHHNPCPPHNADGTVWDCFEDLANRWNSSNVIKKYIDAQHGYGMKSIFYNLAFGVLEDIVSESERNMPNWDDTWYLYKDKNHSERDKHDLPDAWKSDIYLTNPANENWQAWMKARNTEVYNEFNFDGYQIDQLGGRGDLYDYNGNPVNLWETYTTFINAMKVAHPQKRLIMNAVSEYGTWGIAQSKNVDMFYNEVWGWSEDEKKFDNLFRIIKDNEKMDASIKTVFAAYMNYGAHGREVTKEYFNTPGILLTDATIFALGGAHLELGDHMLCDEYFPNSDMKMSDELKTAVEHYYDFHTAYENLLRGSGTELTTAPSCSTVSIKPWYSTNTNGNISVTSMETGKVMSYSRKVGDQQVINLINYRDANSTSWRDYDASMPAPTAVTNLPITVTTSDAISRVWVASPDYNAGAMQQLKFTQNGNNVTFTVPNLKYWTMIVME